MKNVPTVAAGIAVGLTVIAEQICKVMTCVPWQPLASLTRTVNEMAGLAEAVGVPLMMPVLALSDNPTGSPPEVIVQLEYGAVPPAAVRA